MMNEQVYENMKKYAAMLAGDGYVECGYIAVKADDGLYITAPDADFKDLAEDKITFVTDKSVEELEGNFRAAAVLLICALKTKTDDGAAAIVDSKSILEFSARKMTLPPILEDSAQINGVSVRATKQNTAAEVVGAISGARNACFLPDAGAVVTGRTLAEVYTCTLVLDKACNGYLLAEKKGGAQHLNAFEAWLEHMVYKLKYSKKNQSSQKAAEEGKEVDTAEKPSAIDTDELRAVAQEIKDAGVKLLEENLVQGTWGNTAVRLDDDHMLVTPTGLDYVALQPEDMPIVQISDPSVWSDGKKPTSERKIHAAIMAARPEINATIHSHPVWCSVFASARVELPVMSDEMQKLVGGSARVGAYGLPGTKKLRNGTVAAMQGRNACFMANHGVFCAGRDMDEAFEIIRIMERSCKQYIEQKTLEATGQKTYSDELLFDYFKSKYGA